MRLKISRVFLTVFLNLLLQVKCARILSVIPTASLSHQVTFRPIYHELIKRGHEVVVITTDPEFPKGKAPENLTEIDVQELSYKKWKETLVEVMKTTDPVSQIKMLFTGVAKVFEIQIGMKEVKNIINKKSGEFDLLLTEACARPALGFSHIFKVPLIQVSSFGAVAFNDEYVGAYTHPLLFPSPWYKKTYNLTIWEKISKLRDHYDFKKYFNYDLEEEENKILKAGFGKDVPTLNELKKNVDMLLLNIYPLWGDNQPVPPNVVYIAGIHQQTSRDLPQDLQFYLDESKDGAIYFSLGTMAIPSALPQHVIQGILRVLSQVPYNVLLKWDTEDLPISSKNILVRKWFPQGDILKHPNTKLFIMQGGLQSTDEALSAGVPIIGIPILGDQRYNVDKYVKHKIGARILLDSFTEDEFRKAIETVITDKSYRENIVKLRTVMRDQPQPPLERAVWWIEHVLQYGGAHLQPPTANMSMWDYLEMDIILLIMTLVFGAVLSVFLALYIVWKCYCNKIFNTKVKCS